MELYIQVFLTENGHTYYLNPEMITGKDFVEINDSYYKIDSNGYLSKLSDGFYSVAQMQSWRRSNSLIITISSMEN